MGTLGKRWKLTRQRIYIDPFTRAKRISAGLKKAYAEGKRPKIFSGKRGGIKPGSIPWNKGKSWSEEMKEKMKISAKGKHKANAGSFKKGEVPTGADNPNWKGGITTQNRMERNKFKREIQKTVFERDNYICQLCGNRGGYLQVDHIQPWAEYIDLRFSVENCRTLCQECHYKITWGRPIPNNISTWGHNKKNMERGTI